MDTNEAMGFNYVLKLLLSDFWVILMFGLVYFGLKNQNWLKAMALQGPKKKHDRDDHELISVVHGAKTIGLGIVLVNLSYTITGLIYYLIPSNPFLKEGSTLENWVVIGFEVGVIGLIISGYSLILSAGGSWLTYVAKLVATTSVLFMIGALVASYL